jgi:PhnB protein
MRAQEGTMAVNPIPAGYATVTPAFNVKDADKFIDFLKQAFGAEERMRMQPPGGPVMHCELKIGSSIVMLSEPLMDPPTKSATMLYVADCDAVYKRALEAGATSLMEPANQFWGDRFARVSDPFGNRWGIATHVEDVSPEETERRGREFMAQQQKK